MNRSYSFSLAIAALALASCAASPLPPRAECQPIPSSLRKAPPSKLPAPADDSMGALVRAYIAAAEQYHKTRRDWLALDAVITNREECYAGQ